MQPTDFKLTGTVSDGVDRAEFVSMYPVQRRPTFDIGGGVLLRRRFAIGMAVSRFANTQPGTLTVTLTHPAFHPPITGSVDSGPLKHTETSVHLQMGYLVPLGSRVSFTLFGGPSHVRVTQGLITNLDFEEDIDPFTRRWYILGPVVDAGDEKKASAWGYHIGSDISYRLSSVAGVGALVRYTRATVNLENPIQSRIEDARVTEGVTAGGVEITGGVRLRLGQSPGGQRKSGRGVGGWEVEVHAGGAFGTAPSGTTVLPDVGFPFTTFDGFQSRTVASWYFGEGAALFTQNAANRGQKTGISPLDPAFATSSVKAGPGGAFGMRIGRPLTPRLTAEFNLDVAMGGLALTDAARATIESSRSSFGNGFETLLGSQPTRSVASTVAIDDDTGGQIVATGALRVNLLRDRRFTPYVTAGGGVLSQSGNLPGAALTGDYRFTSASGTVYHQTDNVDFRFASRKTFVMVTGGGIRRALSTHSGLRVDARAHFGPNRVKTLLNANPVTVPFTGVPANTIRFIGDPPEPAIQISSTGVRLSTLGAERPDADFQVATGSGIRTLASVTLGYFWLF